MDNDLDLDPLRILRLREERLSPAGAERRTARGTPRLLGRVVNQGAMPGQTGRVFLVSPARIDGAEAEGGTATVDSDAGRVVPVVVIGSRVPAAGDPLVALSIGGRWVAESGPGQGTLTCWPCNLPRKNLTVSWVNPLIGNGSATLVYTPPAQWRSACVNSLLFWLACPGSVAQFGVTYFLSGTCPSGQQQECSSAGAPPLSLSLASRSCDPFYLKYSVTGAGCPILSGGGYSSFTVTE